MYHSGNRLGVKFRILRNWNIRLKIVTLHRSLRSDKPRFRVTYRYWHWQNEINDYLLAKYPCNQDFHNLMIVNLRALKSFTHVRSDAMTIPWLERSLTYMDMKHVELLFRVSFELLFFAVLAFSVPAIFLVVPSRSKFRYEQNIKTSLGHLWTGRYRP